MEFPHDDKHQRQRSNDPRHPVSHPRQEKASGVFHICAGLYLWNAWDVACSSAVGRSNGIRLGTLGRRPGRHALLRLAQITPANVGNLVRAWEFHTGDLESRPPAAMARTKFEATPLFVEDSLILCSPFNEVIALDPGTGSVKWRYDPKISTSQRPGNRYNCRGVAYWVDDRATDGTACRSRIFMGTNDVRVIALDAKTGVPCADFGENGEVKIDIGKTLLWPGEFQITAAPVVTRGVVVVGSSIADNVRVDAPLGVVHAFDARTGAARWSFDPLVHDGISAGAANVWAPMSSDESRGLVFLPTTSPSPDFWGGKRPGNDEHANSVVALRSETGELVWSFQTVHHDVWDYDLPTQPTLARIETGDGQRDVAIQLTKQGFCVRARPRQLMPS
jgi:quinoprotein glucose dehydrogenase